MARGKSGLIAGALAITVAAGVGIYVIRSRRQAEYDRRVAAATERIDELVAGIRSRQEPVTLADLAPPPVEDHDNAAVVLKAVFRRLEALEDEMKDDPPWEHALRSIEGFEARREVLGKAVRLGRGSLAAARNALDRPRCVFIVRYPYSDGELAHLVGLRSLSCLFAGSAMLAASDGESDAALRDVRAMLRLASTLNEEPLVISRYNQFGLIIGALHTLQLVELIAPLRNDHRQLIIGDIQKLAVDRMTVETVEATRAAYYTALCNALETGSPRSLEGPWDTLFPAYPNKLHLLDDGVRSLEAMTAAVAASRGRPKQAEVRVGRIEVGLDTQVLEASPWTAPYLVNDTWHLLCYRTKVAAHRDVAIVGLAAAIYHERTGAFPKTLDALRPDPLARVPLDPYAEKPLLLRHHQDGLVIWSVGGFNKGPIEWRCVKEAGRFRD